MSDGFVPKGPKNLPLRPLDKGIILNVPPQMSPPGGLIDCANYFVTQNGIKRRPGISRYGTDTIDYTPLQDIASFYKDDGTQQTVLIDSKFIYTAGSTAFTAYHWTYTTGTIAVSGATVTGSGTAWDTASNKLLAGDIMVLDADGSGDGPELAEVLSVNSATSITLTANPTGTFGAGTDYAIRRAFGASNPELVDWTFGVDNKLLLVDSYRDSIYSFDGTTYTDLIAALGWIPSCITYFADRIWCGRLDESSVDERHRIRWTNAGSFTAFPAANYIDLPYTQGKIQRLLGMGNLLIAYFEDAIMVGRPSNFTTLPYVFDRVDTGGIGLIGMKALTSWLDSHFFVGQDDIYMFSQGGLQRIGTPVVRRTIQECQNLWRIYAAVEPKNDRVVFGFPKSGDTITELWSWNYKAKAWSYDTVECDALSSIPFVEQITWADLTTETWTTGISGYTSWESLLAVASDRSIYIGNSGELSFYSSDGSQDSGANITGTLETPDYDFGAPDMDKSFVRLSAKTENVVGSAVSFTVTGSLDRGNTWTALGTLTIDANTDEGKINFMITGSICRFRLVSTTDIAPYTVNEIVFRARVRGLEVTQ